MDAPSAFHCAACTIWPLSVCFDTSSPFGRRTKRIPPSSSAVAERSMVGELVVRRPDTGPGKVLWLKMAIFVLPAILAQSGAQLRFCVHSQAKFDKDWIT